MNEHRKALIQNIIGGIAIILMIVYPKPEEITTWKIAFESLLDYLSNPYLIVLSAIGLWGYLKNLV